MNFTGAEEFCKKMGATTDNESVLLYLNVTESLMFVIPGEFICSLLCDALINLLVTRCIKEFKIQQLYVLLTLNLCVV
jgi:hypothetical protein